MHDGPDVYRRHVPVTAAALLAACAYRSGRPADEPQAPTTKHTATAPDAPPPAGSVRHVLIGEMCPTRAGGGPALSLVAVRDIGWLSDTETLSDSVARVASRAFSVLGADGVRAGTFTSLGAAAELGATVTTGGYAGRGVCGDTGKEDAACTAAQAGCGLAIAALDTDPDDAPRVKTASACAASGHIVVDIDGDGALESFPIASLLADDRSPADELVADAHAKDPCTPSSFALPALIAGKDARGFKGLDLLGAVDLDDDGRFELVVQYRYAAARSWAIYSARSTPSRLELMAEAIPWAE